MPQEGRILYCILDWGLGHVSRSIPIVKYLLAQNYTITIGASKASYSFLLQHGLSGLEHLDMRSINPSYSRRKGFFLFKIMSQIPHFLLSFVSDRRRIKAYVKSHKTDVIISDNRFACYHSFVKSIYISHQISLLKSDLKSVWNLASKIHQLIIAQYDVCLIPDQDHALSGLLSIYNGSKLKPIDIGVLSRFESLPQERHRSYVAVLLSGPEPQRTILEQKVILESKSYHGKVVVVRGSRVPCKSVIPANVKVYDLLDANALWRIFLGAYYVVARSGYSSVMDFLKMKMPGIVIPTPGQREQEYLAKHLSESGWFIQVDQSEFKFLSPEKVVNECKMPYGKEEIYRSVIDYVMNT